MTHKSEDELLKYSLELVANDEERAAIAVHLATCSECQMSLDRLLRDLEIIGSARSHQQALLMPHPRRRSIAAQGLLRTAALVVLGVLVGFGASMRVHREPALISSSYIAPAPPVDSVTAPAASDATDVPAHYYEQILEQGK